MQVQIYNIHMYIYTGYTQTTQNGGSNVDTAVCGISSLYPKCFSQINRQSKQSEMRLGSSTPLPSLKPSSFTLLVQVGNTMQSSLNNRSDKHPANLEKSSKYSVPHSLAPIQFNSQLLTLRMQFYFKYTLHKYQGKHPSQFDTRLLLTFNPIPSSATRVRVNSIQFNTILDCKVPSTLYTSN